MTKALAVFILVVGCGGDDGGPSGHDGGGSGSQRCSTIAHTCGPSGTEDCCASATVEGGTYYRDNDVASDQLYSTTSFPATVSGYRLDTYEITVGRFRAFLAEGGGTQDSPLAAGAGAHPNIPSSGWDVAWNDKLELSPTAVRGLVKCTDPFIMTPTFTWTDAPEANEDRPMNCITWFEAFAFCAWDGGFLPTELEWSYAASGGSEQRAYPWSSPPDALDLDASRASYLANNMCLGDGNPACDAGDLLRAGTKPAGNGRWGHADLGGNVWEWVLDAEGDYPTTCADCANVTTDSNATRIYRGGSWSNLERNMRAANRRAYFSSGFDYPATMEPTYRSVRHGARCARSL